MRKRIVLISVVLVLFTPVIIHAEDAIHGTVMLPTENKVVSQEPALNNGSPTYFIPPKAAGDSPAVSFPSGGHSPREWYIIAKDPNSKHLKIGVFLFQEGMPIEHIRSVFGNPKEIITIDVEGYDGTILVYPHHHFFFSKTGHLQTVKEREL